MTEFGGHEFCGVGIDHIGDLEHHSLANEEFDDFNTSDRHPAGQILDSDHIRDDDLTSGFRAFLASTFAFFSLAFPGAPNRSQRTHPFDRAPVITGNSLNCKTTFAPTRLTFGTRDRFTASAGLSFAGSVFFIEIWATVEAEGARSRRLTGRAQDFWRAIRGRDRTAGPGARRAPARRPIARRTRSKR